MTRRMEFLLVLSGVILGVLIADTLIEWIARLIVHFGLGLVIGGL